VIDLDLLFPEAETEPWPVNLRRRWLVTGMFLLVLLLTSGATVPAQPGLPAVRTATLVNTASYRILGDALYITEARADGNWITAYPLAPGPARWTTRVANLADAVGMETVADVVMVGLFQVNVAGDHTVALDRRTGAVRWRSLLNLAGVDRVRGRVVLTGFPAAGLGSGAPSARIEVLTAGTGQRVWGYLRDSACEADLPYSVDRGGTGLALLCRDGSLTLLDLGTGAVRATVRAPVALSPRVVGLPDRVLITYPSAGGTVLVSYDQAGLRPQWTTTIEAGNYGILDCGPRICLGDSVAEVALDRATGKVVWQVRPVGFASPLTDRYVLVAPAQLGDVELVDVGTGRVIMQLGSWTAESAPVGPPMFYQSDGATGRTWVARLGYGDSAVEVLGFVPNARSETCVSNGGYLVCRTVKDTVAVWRYRTG
jgi:hypothetical protein